MPEMYCNAASLSLVCDLRMKHKSDLIICGWIRDVNQATICSRQWLTYQVTSQPKSTFSNEISYQRFQSRIVCSVLSPLCLHRLSKYILFLHLQFFHFFLFVIVVKIVYRMSSHVEKLWLNENHNR